MEVESFIPLRDPFHRINFPIVADGDFYPGTTTIPVDPAIRTPPADRRRFRHRVVSRGARRHALVRRRVRSLPPPHRCEGAGARGADPAAGRTVAAESVPWRRHAEPSGQPRASKAWRSRPNGRMLYPMLEGALTDRLRPAPADHQRVRHRGRALHRASVVLSPGRRASHAIGDLTTVTDRPFLVIERDNFQGDAAQFKKIFLVDLDDGGRRRVPGQAAGRRPAQPVRSG